MGLLQEIKELDKEMFSAEARAFREHNEVLLDIHEGNLLQYVLEDLRNQLTDKAYESAKHRVAPINILPKIIGKLSQVFEKQPTRKAVDVSGADASEADQSLLEWYEKELDINVNSVQGNEYFNLHKGFAFEPYIDQGKPRLRVMPFDRFHVFCKDPVNPLRVTHFAKIMGQCLNKNKETKILYYMYTDKEIRFFYEGGDEATDLMLAAGLDGSNAYGKIPFVYCGRSKIKLVPKPDTDTLQMTKLIPVLMTDLNYAVMYLSFGITWIKNATVSGVRAPNAVWELKEDPELKGAAEIGTIKPEVDIDRVLALIQTHLTMWMDSRNIKSGAVGDITVQNAASGISKAIDEMDTSADRKKQVPFLKNADEELFELVINHMHPVWVGAVPKFEKPIMPSKGLQIETTIPEQRPISDRSKDIADQKMEIEMGIQSKRGAMMALYPDMTEEQIDEKFLEIENESASGNEPQDPANQDQSTPEETAQPQDMPNNGEGA